MQQPTGNKSKTERKPRVPGGWNWVNGWNSWRDFAFSLAKMAGSGHGQLGLQCRPALTGHCWQAGVTVWRGACSVFLGLVVQLLLPCTTSAHPARTKDKEKEHFFWNAPNLKKGLAHTLTSLFLFWPLGLEETITTLGTERYGIQRRFELHWTHLYRKIWQNLLSHQHKV